MRRPAEAIRPVADDDRVAPSRKLHLDDCLALASSQGGRAVAHHFTFLRPSAVRIRLASELVGERVDHRADDHVMRHVAALHRHIGLGIDGIALFHKLFHHFFRVAGGKQRPVVAPPDPFHQHFDVSLKPNRQPVRLDIGPRVRVHIGAAAGRKHLRAVFQQPRDDLALALAEIGLAVLGEDLADARACRHLDLAVGVDEGEVEPVRQPPAHGGLARAHQPDQHDAPRSEGFADRQEPLLPVVFLMVAQP